MTVSPEALKRAAGEVVIVALVTMLCLHATFYLGLDRKDSIMYQTGATLLGPHLYDYGRQRELQPSTWAPYLRAPFYAILFRPLLPFHFDRAWLAARTIALVAFLLMVSRALGPGTRWYWPAWSLLFLSLPINFGWGQDGVVNLVVLSGVLWLRRSGRCLLAGAVLAVTLQKPTLFLLLPLALVIHKERRMLQGYAMAAGGLGALSLVIVGPEGIRDYPRLVSTALMDLHQMPTCRGIADSIGLPWMWPLLSVGALVLFVRVSKDMTFEAAYCMAIVASLLISPNSYSYDVAVILLPALYFSALGDMLQRIGAFTYFFPPVHLLFALRSPWSATNGVVLAAFLVTIARGQGRSMTGCARGRAANSPTRLLSPPAS